MGGLIKFLLLLVTISLQSVSAQDGFQCDYTTDIDQDNDGLIELCDLNALDAVRYQLDGSGYRKSFDAAKITAGCPSGGCDGYELRSDLDFNADNSYRNTTNKEAWTSGLGWLPIGDRLSFFTAIFEGNGHTISNLYINRPSDYIGLFTATAKLAKISDLVLSQTSIKGNSYVGSLAGHNAGSIAYIGVEGGRLIGMGNNVGGLFGVNAGTILNGDVVLQHVKGDGHSAGGLVGHNEGHITYSVADTSLSGVSQVGGLVGLNSGGVLGNNRSDGTAKGNDYVGGLVGLNRGRISASHAKGKVISDGSYSGGLVGTNDREGRIIDSRADGAVSGNLYAGGLVGWNNDSQITNSFALSRVEANNNVGGVVGWNEGGQISNTYASGFVGGVHRVGGLVGSNKGIVSNSFANGQVVASGEHIGGLIGWSQAYQTRHTTAVRVIHSYWDSEAVGISLSAGGGLRTTAQLRLPTAPGLLGETFERWNIDDWDFGTSEQHPLLRHSGGANKGHLLPGQHSLLSGLLVLDGLNLSPAFNSQTFDYRINISDDSLRQTRFIPTIANSTQTISVLKDEEISLPSVSSGDTVAINLNTAPEPTLITIARHYRIWVIRQSGLEATISSDRSEHRVDEGQSIAFDVSSSEPDLRRVRHRWSQVSPTQPNLLTDLNTQQAKLSIDIPDDFVTADADETPVVLQVEVSANGRTVVRNTTMTVVKTNGGGISALAAPTYRDGTLTIADMSEADLSMEPDGGVDLSSFRYRWQYELPSASTVWQDIEDATQMGDEVFQKIPQVLSEIDNVRYRVSLDYRDNQGHQHRVVSEPLSFMKVVEDDGFSDIYYLEDLYAIRNRLNGRYELVRDLDFNSDASYRDPINKAKWTVADYEDSADTGWLPIGSLIYHFTGVFRGNGYTIFNLQINRDTADYQGLFAFLRSGSAIRNVGLLNVKIEGGRYVGGLAGLNRGTIINGHAVGEFSGNSLVGGIAGENSGKVINSYASSAMSRGGSHFGGLVGTNQGLVINSHATARILAGQPSNSGGLIGWNAMNANVINSYASGDIRSASPIGGLTGINRGSITNSYATGNVSGSGVGGLVGNNQRSTAMITNSYATGNVSGSGGGLVSDNVGVISASYWDAETSGLQGSHGSGQTTRQMQLPTMAIGIFEAWGDDDWDFGNSEQYPILKYAPGPDGDGCVLAGLPQCGELVSPRLRYGLRSLAMADDASLSPEFNVGEQNQSGIYIGTLRSTDNTIRLIPATIEPTAHISLYINDNETVYDRIRSGETSEAVSLKENDMTRIHIKVQGTQTVRYTLYIHYQNTAADRVKPINHLEDLRAIHRQLGGSYKLARDLDFTNNESYLDPLNRILWTVDDYDDASDTGWVPIGSESQPFAGSFDGNGYTISGLQINRDTTDNQGLFGVTSSSTVISNIGLLNAKVEGRAKVAGLVGINRGQVGYSYVVGNIRSKSGGTAGGLVASNDGGDIIGSYAISEVSGTSSLGGLVGDNGGRIINSYADSIVSALVPGGSGFGGLAGRNRSLIANSYATGKILASGSSIIGGLVGRGDHGARIINGYASLSIEGAIAGGLVGYKLGSIENSYAVGELSGGRTEGSLVGSDDGGAIVASYWNTDTIAVGSNHGIGQTTLQLQSATPTRPANSIYEDWDTDDWDFGTSEQYPILKHTAATGSIFGCGSAAVPQCGDLISPGLRYGLRGLRPASDVTFHPPIDIEKLNRSGVYIGTVIAEHPSVRLIPVAMESTARISVIGTMREAMDSHETSLPISLKNDRINKVVVEVEGTQTLSYTLYLNYSYHRLIDADGDGLVDINYLEDLDAIRHQSDGSGYRADVNSIKIISGCPSDGCKGYELLRDLDFNDVGSYRNANANRHRWTGAGNWQPIGSLVGIFKGNNKTIANLRVRGNGGLFAAVGSDNRATHIDGIGLLGVDIRGNTVAGITTSCKRCTISNSYVIGSIEGGTAAAGLLNTITATSGGQARISNSYFVGNLAVEGQSAVAGGLVGDVDSNLTITDSYVAGTITAQHDDGFMGGLIGVRTSSVIDIINNYASVLAIKAGVSQGLFGGNKDPSDKLAPTVHTSYLDKDISGINVTLGLSKRTAELQSPTSATDIYTSWGSDNLGNSDNWDFGSNRQYPAIKYNLRGDMMLITPGDAHCATADIQKRPAACQTLLRHQGSLLQDLQLSEGAGLSSPFAFTSFDYGISVNADQSTIRLLPTAFNAVAAIEVFKDGNSVGVSDSGEWTVPIPLNDYGNTVVGLVVTEGNRHSYPYWFTVNRLGIVAQNIDQDGDGLIEINDATHLNAIRHRLDGSAYQQGKTADAIYCSGGCIGYELTADIDLAGMNWQPIGSFSEPFTGVFRGNGHTISNLSITGSNTIGIGLFGAVGENGRVENVGLVNANIAGRSNIGSIAGYNFGTIINSHADGKLVAMDDHAGGLVGRNRGGMIANSYAYVDVDANGVFAGGLVGFAEVNSSIVNSYALGDVQAQSGNAGGLVGSNDRSSTKIHNSYAIGEVRTINGLVGGLTASGGSIVNSYHRAGAVSFGTVSFSATTKTMMVLKAGVPSDDVYTGWERADWHFGNSEQYPALLYAPGDDDSTTCRQPSPKQLSDCDSGFAGLSGHDRHDKSVLCRSHLSRLPEQSPYCGALLPEQRAGLVRLEFSENAQLIPAFNPEIYDYHLVVGSGIALRTTPTAYYGAETITVNVDGLSSLTDSRQGSLFNLSDDSDRIVFEVQSATQSTPTVYTIMVLQDIAVVDGLIMIDYLEDLNLMRYSLAQVSATLTDCPIDTQDDVRRCKGYKLARDLDFKNPTSYRAGVINPMWTAGKGWQPIGNSRNPFSDLFNGNGQTISNLRIHGIPTSGSGLFGVLATSARIENIGLLNVDIDVNNIHRSMFDIGALAGENYGEIVNSYVIAGRVHGDLFVGGLVGRSRGGVIINSYTSVDVQANHRAAGGLVGIGINGTSAENERESIIRNSYTASTVSRNHFAGGLAAYFSGEIRNSYATGDVSGDTHVGGLIGRLLLDTAGVNNNYVIGKVTGNGDVGGLVGSVANASLRDFVSASYWDINTSSRRESVAGTSKTTAELRASVIGDGIYSNWDSDDWYSGGSSQYPTLRYTSATDVLARPACRAAEDLGSEMPVCGTLLPAQRRTGLSNLARSNHTGQVLLLRPNFNPGIYDYELILKSDAREFSIIPYTFDPDAAIILKDHSQTNRREELRNNRGTTLAIDSINSLLLTLTVEDTLVSKTTKTTVYSIRVSKHPFVNVNDIDEDDDGLIEIRSAEGLSAMRYQLDGSGYRASQDDTKITVGCPTTPTVGCKGYELAAGIDLSGSDWQPIGMIDGAINAMTDATTLDCNDTPSRCFTAIFNGNRALGYEISGLSVASQRDHVGLFAALADSAQVSNVNLSDVDIQGRFGVGSLAAYNAGEIDNSYADGAVAGEGDVGGLVAINDDQGRISNSHAYGMVSGDRTVGGLVARNESSGMIANSYSLSHVSGNNNIGGLVGLNLGAIANTYASGDVQGKTRIGGLVGENGGSVGDSYATASVLCTGVPACATYAVAIGGLIGSDAGGITLNSYWDIEASNIQVNIQGLAAGIGKTGSQLRSGSSQSSDAIGAYYQWSDSDWHFGNADQYPILKYTSSTESMLTGLQSYGLASLTIAQVVTLSPHFDTTKLYYRVGVEADTNIQHLHLTPSALNAKAINTEAIIRIVSDNGFDETVESGTSSSAIVLRSTDTTVISVEVSGERRVRYRFEVDYFPSSLERDVDADGDGLIEILRLEDLDAIRNDLAGRRLRHQNDDGVFVESARGCPTTGCRGYELLRDLNFDNPTHYRAGRVNTAWTSGAGWQPIGTHRHPFVATFKGNGYTISNLRVNRPDSDSGLFGVIDGIETHVAIEGLGLLDVNIVGGEHVGGLVGYNRAGDISQSYVTGSVMANGRNGSAIVGGLVGRNVGGSITESYSETQVKGNLADRLMVALAGGLVALNDDQGRIENSYTIGSVIGWDRVGGLVALNRGSSQIINSYAVSRAIAIGARSNAGGLVAVNDAMVGDSYWDMEASDVPLSDGGTSATTMILQSSTPTSSISLINKGVYRNWDADVWEFGDTNHYPMLKAIANPPLLARKGKSLLQTLTLSDNVRLFPLFHPLIFDYDIIAESEQMTEIRLNTTPTQAGTTIDVACSARLICSPNIPTSFALDGSYAPQITITTHNPNAGKSPYNFSVRYATSEIRRVTATTTTTIPMPLTAAEGERVRLTAPYNFGLNQDLYRYTWRQLAGNELAGNELKLNDVLSPVDTKNAVLDFTVPSDVVAKRDDSRGVRLSVEIAVNDDVYLTKTLALIISKRNNDAANRINLLRDNDKAHTHTYNVRIERKDGSEFVDRDGGFATTQIQWQRRRSEVEGWIDLVSTPTYTLPNEGDYQYRVLAVYEDNQGYREQLESEVINYLDVDDDNDGLIEIAYLEELDAIRHQPDGSGYKATASADKITAGCPLLSGVEKCRGYELINDLDFNNDASYRTPNPSLLKDSWTVSNFLNASDSGWQPSVLNGVFNGNGYTISNMQINRSVGNLSHVGLFFSIGSSGRIENLGLVDPAIKGLVGIKNVGGIAGSMQRDGVIVNSYVVGDVAAGNTDKIIRGDVGFGSGRGFIGGMVGWNKGFILNSYAKINVVAEDSGMASNKQVGVGGLVGRNIDGGKVYNSYATGEVKGPCVVSGLVGNQFSTDSSELLKRSEIKNSYTTGNIETGFGSCVNANNQVASGLVGRNTNSTVENSYTLGKISGDGALAGLVGGGSAASNSYWNYNTNCSFVFTLTTGVGCFGTSENFQNSRTRDNFRSPIAPNTELDSCPESFITEAKSEDVCDTYVDWDVADWHFGTSSQFPALKYGLGLDTNNPGCDTDAETALPSCDALLPGQIADTLLLNSLSLLVNSENVRLTPDFMPSRFNYEAMIESETAPVAIQIAASADEDTVITIRKDGGAPLIKQSDGTVHINTSTSFNLKIETASGNNRETSYQIQVRLKYPPQLKISKAINGSTPTKLIRANILRLNEGDAIRFDATESFGQNDSPLDYRWSQISGKPLLSQIQSASTLGFTVPANFVARDEDEITMVLKLELSEKNNPASTVSREIPLSVRKVDNGDVGGAAKWINSDTLSASDLSGDIDGGVLGDTGYQWSQEQNGMLVALPGATQKSYTPSADARNAQYRLSISYTDGQGYETNLHYDAPLFRDIVMHRDKDNDGLIEIETLEDLDAIRYQLDGSGYRASSTANKITAGCPDGRCSGYELTRNLDFMDDNSYRIPTNKARYIVTTATELGWQPIGNSSLMSFKATFDGNGYAISNLMINRTGTRYVGLFGYTGTAAKIANLGLLDVDISGRSFVGSLVGNNNGTITNSYAIGTVSGRFDIGGLIGVNQGGTITNSYAMGAVSGRLDIGGLVGQNDNGSITHSYAIAEVKGSSNRVGGLAGRNPNGSIMSSYAAGKVDGEDDVGGLVGSNANGIIMNSYATSDVSGLSNASNLVGSNTGTITNSYTTGDVTVAGRAQTLGLVAATSNDVNHSYWLSGSAALGGIINALGRIDAEKTAEELKSPIEPGTTSTEVYYNWDATVWDFGTAEEYPALKYHDNSCGTSMPFLDCGRLLLHQRVGLRDLRLEQNVRAGHLSLSPEFDTAVTTYTVSAVHADASELRIIPIAVNPDAIIVADDKVLPTDDVGYTIALNPSGPTSTVISVAASNSIATEEPVVYMLTVDDNRLPKIGISAPASIVEGETFALNATIEDPEEDELSYSLSVAPNLNICRGGFVCLPASSTGTVAGRADLRYELDIPSDLLDEMQSTNDVEIVLTVDDSSNDVVSETMQLTIVKENNGVILVPAPTLDRFTYTIAGIDLSSDSDGTNPTPEIAYQWQKELLGNWLDIDDAIDASHTVEGIIGDRYRVLVGYSDKQGYRHQGLASPAVSAPQQFVYDAERSRNVARDLMERQQPRTISIQIRVFLEGLLR